MEKNALSQERQELALEKASWNSGVMTNLEGLGLQSNTQISRELCIQVEITFVLRGARKAQTSIVTPAWIYPL